MTGHPLDDAARKQVEYAIKRAGYNPDECEVLAAPRRVEDDEMMVRVRLPDGGTMRVTY
jgi:hypothetical protein